MKAVLFDLFGTLVDNFTNAAVEQYHNDVADALRVDRAEFRHGWSATFYDRSIGKYASMRELLAAAASYGGSKYSSEGLERAVEIRREFSREWLVPRADTSSTLNALKQRGFRIGLLSNCSNEIPEIWETLDVAKLIDVPLYSCHEGLRKPMPEFFLRAIEKLHVAPSECLYVADGDNGEMAAATGLGIPAVLIRSGDDEFRQEAEEWGGPRIERLSELLQHENLQSCS